MKIATRKALIEALERLMAGTPNDRNLRKKAQHGKLKINN
ncbi:bacterioferritin comigratory protein, partial [Vibrio renipiscarius]